MPFSPQPASPVPSNFGSLNFHIAFDFTFPHPVPLLVTASSTGASVDSLSLLVTLKTFLDWCTFHLFVPLFCSDYVDTFAHDDVASLQATITALKKVSMIFKYKEEVLASDHDIFQTPVHKLLTLPPGKIAKWLTSRKPIILQSCHKAR
jgi:hypothetical protein